MRAKSKAARYRQRLRFRAFAAIGTVACQKCGGTGDLEFAHKAVTGLSGRSRGMDRRYRDVINNPNKYCLLCHGCHIQFDKERNHHDEVTNRRATGSGKGQGAP